VKPSPFEYFAPATLDEALALLAEHGSDAKPLAGGQSLIPAMNFRLATPSVLVDLNRIQALSAIVAGGPDDPHGERDGAAVRIGAMARHREVERSTTIAEALPLLSLTMPFIAHAAIRTRGTLGGSLAHADPAAELPAVMLALQAEFTLQSQTGRRTVPAAAFFTGLFSTALEPGELLVEIAIPARTPRSASAFEEISRRHGDFALAGAAAYVEVDAAGVCTAARVGLLSVADKPVLSEAVARTLVGQRPTTDAVRAAADAAARDDIDPTTDIHATSAYRRHLAAVLTRRVLARAFHSLEPA
jgi:CO/xanthine dehydrogenase FAD-binding subunit